MRNLMAFFIAFTIKKVKTKLQSTQNFIDRLRLQLIFNDKELVILCSIKILAFSQYLAKDINLRRFSFEI